MTLERYRYALIGAGKPWKTEGATGFGMGHTHVHGFLDTQKVELVAIADINEGNAQLYIDKYAPEAKFYADYREILAAEKPDIVSIATWPHLHAEMAVAACEAGIRAVHCEKPMATKWGDAKRMKAAADANGTLLTFNHQRRFLEPFQRAAQMIRDGEIGELRRMESTCGDMFDWGTHWIDIQFMMNGEIPAEWVIGQIDSRRERKAFGAYMEEQAICHYKAQNGVRGLMVTGFEANIGATHRFSGTDGVLEINNEAPYLRIRAKGDADWRTVETVEGIHGNIAIDRACADLVRALDEPGHKPLLSVDNAVHTAEVIFATYYSSLKRGRVDLPLTYDDNALHEMLAAGQVGPNRTE